MEVCLSPERTGEVIASILKREHFVLKQNFRIAFQLVNSQYWQLKIKNSVQSLCQAIFPVCCHLEMWHELVAVVPGSTLSKYNMVISMKDYIKKY